MNNFFVFKIMCFSNRFILAVGVNGFESGSTIAQDNMSMSMDNSSMRGTTWAT
jgi:hypothetical protein